MDEPLLDALCEEIAKRTIYPFDAIKAVYERLQSIDLTIAACDYAAAAGIELYRIVNGLVAIDELMLYGNGDKEPVGILNIKKASEQ